MERYGNLEFATKKELFKFLFENKEKLIAQKRAVKKEADCPVIVAPVIVQSQKANKADMPMDKIKDSLKVVVVINTTNFLDSHNDLHLPGIWNKSIKENKMIMHLQEHEMEFEKIIADGEQLKVYTKVFNWSELGYSFAGTTEALVFESTILKSRNEYMMNQYANGWVKNHSVGMYYVKMDFAVNDEEYPNEYEAWQKYYPQIANKDVADSRGYFWYVLEAKCAEGSAVPMGSNTATPTLSTGKSLSTCPNCQNEFDYNSIPEAGMGYVNCPKCSKPVSQKYEPSDDTHTIIEPVIEPLKKQIDYNYLIKNLNL
jgi:hypothetical protein